MPERVITLPLTQTQCNTLATLLDVAVKAGGIPVAKQAVWFITEMEIRLNQPDQVPNPSTEPSQEPSGITEATVKDAKGNCLKITGDNIRIKAKDSPE
jgi:hypothetical protein